MDLHIKIVTRSTVTIDHPEDIAALRVLAEIGIRALDGEMRGNMPSTWERQRAYQLALKLSQDLENG